MSNDFKERYRELIKIYDSDDVSSKEYDIANRQIISL
jgi:hypothetical protein